LLIKELSLYFKTKVKNELQLHWLNYSYSNLTELTQE